MATVTAPWLLVALSVLTVSTTALSPHSPYLFPKPQTESPSETVLQLLPDEFALVATGQRSGILEAAFDRYQTLFFVTSRGNSRGQVVHAPQQGGEIRRCNVDVKTANTTLDLDTDESYSLSVASGNSTITATTVFGALRALETFSQLVRPCVTTVGQFMAFCANQTKITDFPRFRHRGYMIDTSRHWLPVDTIKQHLDAMAYSKFNVLHWHIVDGQSFPYNSLRFPDLVKGAYTPSHTYSFTDIRELITYAYERGIRVVPEFDTPGHTFPSWGVGQPGILTDCYDSTKKRVVGVGPLNPTSPAVFPFVTALFQEVAELFPDHYLHLGGDEVSFDCWMSNPQINAWMKQHNYSDYASLEQYYETQLLDIVNKIGKGYIVWQEIFDNGLKVRSDTVIDVWKGGWQDEMSKVTKAGLKAIVSSPWYLNYISYGSDWPKYYQTEPLNFTGTQAQKDLVMGGEVCMWGEYVDATNAIARTWPRASAVGERLWSAEDVTDVDDARVRMHNFRCLLLTRGIDAEPPNGPSYCDFEWRPSYIPPWEQP